MSVSQLRQFWQFVEREEPRSLIMLDDPQLLSWLVSGYSRVQPCSQDELEGLRQYIAVKLLLIRDLAQSRLGTDHLQLS